MKLRLLPLVCAPVLALVGCSAAEITPLNEARVQEVSELRDALAGTDYNCSNWQELKQEEGVCAQKEQGQIKFKLDGTPEDYARYLMEEQFPYAKEVIVGENWVGRCDNTDEGTCQAIADGLGVNVKQSTRS